MFKRTAIIALFAFLSVFLSGCDVFTAETAELLAPPSISGDLKPISDAINATAQSGYTLIYPSRGDYRSAVIREDINNDGVLEAFAFYSTIEGEVITMHINAICKNGDTWSSVGVQKIVAGGVDKIEFSDLDGDGQKEILVGWEIYGTSEMQVAVYSLTETMLTQRMLQEYTHFVNCDLDEDDKSEILILKSIPGESVNIASLFAITEEGITEISSCMLDSSSKTLSEPIIHTLSNGKPAVYIDEIKGVGAVTEVLFLEKGVLVNPLLSAETGETLSTLRSVIFSVTDINNDGILEIPVQENVPSVAVSNVGEKLYLTNWCSFNGETLTNQMTAMMNVNDGYSFVIPKKWQGNIAILKNTDSHLREIYAYNPEDETIGESLMYIKVIEKKSWDESKYSAQNIYEIMNNGETSFICYVSPTAVSMGIDFEYVKSNFKLFE